MNNSLSKIFTYNIITYLKMEKKCGSKMIKPDQTVLKNKIKLHQNKI